MKTQTIVILPLLLGLAISSCQSNRAPKPVDNAMLAKLNAEQRGVVVEARALRDASEDQYAIARNQTLKADEQVAQARARLKTVRSQLNETLLAIQAAEETGTVSEWEDAKQAHREQLLEAHVVREELAVAKRVFELAKLQETLALEELQMSKASLELRKAEVAQNVDLVAAKRLPVKDYRRQVTYHREEVEIARARVRSAQARLEEAQQMLHDAEARQAGNL